jgi:acyl carrier protein
MDNEIKEKVIAFIIKNYLFGDTLQKPGDDVSLIEEGIVDSTGILELIEFLETSFDIEVKDTETLPQNLGSISNLVRFIETKKVSG